MNQEVELIKQALKEQISSKEDWYERIYENNVKKLRDEYDKTTNSDKRREIQSKINEEFKHNRENQKKLETFELEIYNIMDEKELSEKQMEKYGEINTAINDTRFTYTEGKSKEELERENYKAASKISDAYSKEQGKYNSEINKEYKATVDNLKRLGAALGFSKVTYTLRDYSGNAYDKTITLDKAINEITRAYLTVKDSKANNRNIEDYKIYEETKNRLEKADEYKEGVSKGLINEEIVFKTQKGFNPQKALVNGREALEKMATSERRIISIKSTIDKITENRRSSEEFQKTIEVLSKLKAKEEKELASAQKDYDKSNFIEIEKLIDAKREKERIKQQQTEYARLYARYLELKSKDPDNKSELDQLQEYLDTNGAGLDSSQLEEARRQGYLIVHEKENEQLARAGELAHKQLKEEQYAQATRKVEEQLYNDKRDQGHSHDDAVEEVKRVLSSETDKYIKEEQENKYFLSLSPQDREIYLKRKADGLDPHIPVTPQATEEIKPKKSIQEIVLEELIKEGTFKPYDTIYNLTPVQKSKLDYFVSRKIEEEAYETSKKEYETYKENERNYKIEKMQSQMYDEQGAVRG